MSAVSAPGQAWLSCSTPRPPRETAAGSSRVPPARTGQAHSKKYVVSGRVARSTPTAPWPSLGKAVAQVHLAGAERWVAAGSGACTHARNHLWCPGIRAPARPAASVASAERVPGRQAAKFGEPGVLVRVGVLGLAVRALHVAEPYQVAVHFAADWRAHYQAGHLRKAVFHREGLALRSKCSLRVAISIAAVQRPFPAQAALPTCAPHRQGAQDQDHTPARHDREEHAVHATGALRTARCSLS